MGVLTVSLLFMLVESSALPSPDTLNTTHWLLLLLVAILLMAATLFVQYGVSRIPATRASVLFLFELVVAAVASYYIAHETMSVNEWIGGGLIVVAAIFAATHEK
jgi:drug/metabolite transporter (DMT)-like permease